MKVYNSMTRRKEALAPVRDGQVGIYVCGPTVYNYIHIGNARPMVVFDTLRRYLEFRGYKVTYVQNFTDVDDKIINKAREEGVSALEVAEKFIGEYFDDAAALHVRKADVHPRVSENIPDIIAFVQKLIDKGYAYEADGDVYFSTRKFPDYGKLSGQNIDDLEAGSRIAVGDVKKDPLDFAIWKAQKNEGEVAWASPWGPGRPGWHIECSTMSNKYIGPTIDIHGGGEDLKFPHHENEIAQSECGNGVPFVKYWMHNGFITIDAVKMSKSAGNFFTVRDIRKAYPGEVIRFFLLQGQYRSPLDFSKANMEQAEAAYARISNCRDNLAFMMKAGREEPLTAEEEEALREAESYRDAFIEAMDDDLNTADGISAVFELVSFLNNELRGGTTQAFARLAMEKLRELTDVLGLLQEEEDRIPEGVRALVAEREEARKVKDWKRADQIRDQLQEEGYTLKDTPQGVQIVRD